MKIGGRGGKKGFRWDRAGRCWGDDIQVQAKVSTSGRQEQASAHDQGEPTKLDTRESGG
jgi:hypothetical protein